MSTVKTLYSDVSLLEACDFANTESLRLAAEGSDQPSLLIVEPCDLSNVLDWLDDKDDVCLAGSPIELINHRIKSLSRQYQRRLDPLTQLISRQPFNRLLINSCLESNEQNPVSILLCDLDNFKLINDQFGHSVGDETICVVAELLKQMFGQAIAIGRMGGAQFGIVVSKNAEDAMAAAEQMRCRVKENPVKNGVRTTISLGVASTAEPIDGRELMQRADQALYTAKADGRDCCVSFDQMAASSLASGNDVAVIGLENQARVLAERVANVITMRSRRLLSSARKEADIDGLTGCFNRRYLDRRLEAEFDRRSPQPLTVAFMDLDHFGQVNKKFGWSTGDKILVEVCNTIRGSIRGTDWVGRYGGEEFCLVMPDTDLQSGLIALKRIREAIASSEYRSTCDQLVAMTVSIGAAMVKDTDQRYMDLLDRASQSALEAKRNGRNQIQLAE